MLIRPEAFPRGLIRKDARPTVPYAQVITVLALEECKTLDDNWVSRNPSAKPYFHMFVRARILRELLAFYIAVTDRDATRHRVNQAESLVDAVSDDIREGLLTYPWQLYSREQQREVEVHQAAFIEPHAQWLRRLYPYLASEPLVSASLLGASESAIATLLCYGTRVPNGIAEFVPLVRVRLLKSTFVLKRSAPSRALAAGGLDSDARPEFR